MIDNKTTYGSLIGLSRRATITKYVGNGKVEVKYDVGGVAKEDQVTHIIDLPLAYATKTGAFIGGFPEIGSTVYLEQAQGETRISGYLRPDNVFQNNEVLEGAVFDEVPKDLMSEFSSGRILIQSEGKKSRILIDKDEGLFVGNAKSSYHFDTQNDIVSHNFKNEFSFTSAHRLIVGEIKRDLESNSFRNVEGSILNDHNYPLKTIGMEPDQETSVATTSVTIRNLPLVEHRQIFYEMSSMSPTVDFQSDLKESDKYNANFFPEQDPNVLRIQSRANTFNLNLYNPNHLIEEIKGTGVDTFGNILDLNRAPLPIGFGTDEASFAGNEDLVDAFKKIRAQHRKSLAYHFEINARKQQIDNETFEVPSSTNIEDNMGRFLSTFFVDIDKEGQFKINVPSSSETGNIPLPVRYVPSSVKAYEAEKLADPNYFSLEDDYIDIFLQDYSITGRFKSTSCEGEVEEIEPGEFPDNFGPFSKGVPGIKLIGDEGEVTVNGTNRNVPIRLNTPYHNIIDAGFVFTKKYTENNRNTSILPTGLGDGIVRRPFDALLNTDTNFGDSIQYEDIVSKEIKVSGKGANAGGRSGSFNLDGFLQLGIGANTIDRQSLWLDTAGGIVSTIGKDKNNISYCATLDGAMLIQVGGVGVGTSSDSRFSEENDGCRTGIVDIRVVKDDGQVTVVRIDGQGVNITSFGRVTIESAQDMTLKSKGQLNLDGELISFYSGDNIRRTLKRDGNEI